MEPLKTDLGLLFAARMLRMFAYGGLSVVLALYLAGLGLPEAQIGLLFTLTLAGDALITLGITNLADWTGRRRMLRVGAWLMAGAGAAFLLTDRFGLLAIAAILGVLSPSGNEIGPFLSIEQSALAQLLPDRERTRVIAWYNLAGSFSTALGALAAGLATGALQQSGFSALQAYRFVLAGYAGVGVLLIGIYFLVSRAVELPAKPRPQGSVLGLHASRGVVLRLSALFALDAFGGGFVVQSLVAFWFAQRFGASPVQLGGLFFAANLLASISALSAVWIARRIGLVRTMVFTHLPSNLLLMLVPVMPSFPLAAGLLLLRYSISQMDVPTRQSYTLALVAPDERSAAAGVTAIARSVGAAASPAISGWLMASQGWFFAPFWIAGGLKILYDLALYRGFKNLRPPEEKPPG